MPNRRAGAITESLQVLFISQVYPPEPEVRVSSLAEALVDRGHRVTVFTSFPSYPQGKLYPGFRQNVGQWEVRKGVRVLRLPSFIDHSPSPFRRSLSYVTFAATTMAAALNWAGPVDVVCNFHPPLTAGAAGLWSAFRYRAPLVFDVQDLWPDVFTATGLADGAIMTRTVCGLMDVLYRRTAALTVVCTSFRKRLIEAGVPDERIRFLPVWVDENMYRPLPQSYAVGREFGLADTFNIMFAGAIGIAQGLDVVIEAALRLRDLGRVRFVMIGDGADVGRLKALGAERKVNNVIFIPRQPPERMPELFSLAGALLVHLRDAPGFRMSMPAKMQSYMACGRPIIMAVAGEAAEFVRRHNVGLVSAPENVEALAQTVRDFYTMKPQDRERMGLAGRAACLEIFAKSKLVERYEALLYKVVAEHRRGKRQDKVAKNANPRSPAGELVGPEVCG